MVVAGAVVTGGVSEFFLYGGSSRPDEFDAMVRSELNHGEQSLWLGQPRPSRFARQTIPLVLFGIPFTAFAILWTTMATWGAGNGVANAGAPAFFSVCFPLWGVPFILIGLGMLSSPFWFRRMAKRTCYALTDHRAILYEGGAFGGVEVRSYVPASLTRMVRREFADGTGDLAFEEQLQLRRSGNSGTTVSKKAHGFLAIDSVR
jgi:hypothetical protein